MTDIIHAAFELMYKLEPEKYRKFSPLPYGKEIYWTHLYSVYKLCIYWGEYDENLLLAAILHDVVEDTEYTLDEVESNFGKPVADIVSLCTKKKDYITFKEEDQKEYFSRIINFHDNEIRRKAMIIKLADRLDNLMGASFIYDINVKQRYYDETRRYYIKIAQELGKEEILENLLKYVNLSQTKTFTAR